MATYADVDDIRSRIGGRVIDATSSPSTSEVDAMIDEAEAELVTCLIASGLPEASISVEGAKVLRHWISNYISGWVRTTHAAAAGDGDNTDGQELRDKWQALLERIMENAAHYVAMLGGGFQPDDAIDAVSYMTDNDDGKSILGGDFDPVITTTEVW